MPLESQTCKKVYFAPKLNKLTPQQAQLLLIGRATFGDQGAKDLLEIIYPAPQSKGNETSRTHFEEREPGSISPRMPSLVHRTFSALGRTADSFHRWVRG